MILSVFVCLCCDQSYDKAYHRLGNFRSKIRHVLNFRVKSILLLDSSAMYVVGQIAGKHISILHVFNWHTDENILTVKISRSTA